jgi:hypothetical protein
MLLAFPSVGLYPHFAGNMPWLNRYCKAFAIANCRTPSFLHRLSRALVSTPGKRDKSRA